MNLDDRACIATILYVQRPDQNALNVYHLNSNQKILENICI